MIHRLCVIGVGLIGGSLARALRVAGAVETIVGVGRGEENLARALELKVIDEYVLDPAVAVHNADIVVVAAALGAILLAGVLGLYWLYDRVVGVSNMKLG